MRLAVSIGWMLLPALVLTDPAGSYGAEIDRTTQSAIYLLRSSKKIGADYRRTAQASRMLRALRHIGDPDLAPFFGRLAESESAWLKVHGMLGLAECSPQKRIDMVRLAAMEQRLAQRLVVSAAMDQNLIDLEQCRQLMALPELDPTVKVVVATFLIHRGQQMELDQLRASTEADDPLQAYMAAALLVQCGQSEYLAQLEQLNQSDRPHRDQVREHLLKSAFKLEFDRLGPWALLVSQDPNAEPPLQRLSLQVALRFNAPDAITHWQQQFRSTAELVQKMRLAIVALNVSHWADQRLYDPMLESQDHILQQIGRTGQAVAAQQDVVNEVIKAIELNQPRVSQWALDYAGKLADDEQSQQILLAVILAIDGPVERRRAQRTQQAIQATTALADRDAEVARALLRPILADPQSHRQLVRGILAGLMQCRASDPYPIVNGLVLDDIWARSLQLLIGARGSRQLNDAELSDLALLVRGGGQFKPHIRVQAAWAYLQRTDQVRLALAEVLGR